MVEAMNRDVAGWAREEQLTWEDGAVYEGDLLDGAPHGVGRMLSENFAYHGQFFGGQPHGRGIMIHEKWKFKGVFCAGEPVKCEVTNSRLPGCVYKGELRDFRFSGRGEYHWADREGEPEAGTSLGTSYIGDWQDGKMHGRGKLTAPGVGCEWHCWFQEGKQHGQGQLRWLKGSLAGASFEGEFREGGLFEGTQLLAQSKQMFEGRFAPNGGWLHGKQTLESGTVWQGDFEHGSCVQGKLISEASGTTWEGKFDTHGLLQEGGMMRMADGSIIVGKFEKNVPICGHKITVDGEIMPVRRWGPIPVSTEVATDDANVMQ